MAYNHPEVREVRSKKTARTETEIAEGIVKTLVETDQCADRTMGALNHQDEQLAKTARDIEKVEDNLAQSDKLLKRLRPGACFRSLFGREEKRTPTVSRDPAGPPSAAVPSAAKDASKGAERLRQQAHAQAEPKTGASGRKKADAEEEKLDALYDQMEGLLGGLKVKADEIHGKVSMHNEILPGLTEKISIQEERARQQNKQMQKLHGK